MTICVMCAKNEATQKINSPNHDHRRVGTWDVCWECAEYVNWVHEMIKRNIGLRIKELNLKLKMPEELPEQKKFDEWFLEKYNKKPTIPYTSKYPIERRL